MHHRSSFDMFQDRGTLFVRPAGSGDVPRPASVAVLVDMVTDAAASLPDVLGARQAYRDLRTFAQDDRPQNVHGYFGEVAAAVRVIVPLWKPPKAPKAPTKQLTPTERNADYRARKTAEERDTSAKWLQPMPRRCRTALATAAPAGRPTGVRRP